ncbi:GNAT family N-acetyltransferase [Maridesulfovibrio sp.]|uniref:GNAT family N-acetyltransferase n=1 Tax=Maridesulfovibrio sp. TaxID=2795000 RepID=UPI002A18D393|nr:GNAT family N-acetyltransferase [Maridesulfovibrio sp.]
MYGFEIDGGYTFYKYRDFDGTLSLTAAHLKWFWSILEDAGTVPVIFYDGTVRGFNDFKQLAELPDQHLFLGFRGQEPAGLFWLNGFTPRACYVHIASMPGFYGRGSVQMGRGCLAHLLAATDASGRYLFDCIKGLIPASNQLACRFAEKSGFRQAGIVPNGAYLSGEDISIDAVLFCAVRKGDGICPPDVCDVS